MNEGSSTNVKEAGAEEDGMVSKAAGAPAATRTAAPSQVIPTASAPSRANPSYVPIIDKRSLTHEISSKSTIHLGLSLANSRVAYEPGDACGILAANNPRIVDEMLTSLNFDGNQLLELDKVGTVSLYEALLQHLVITKISRRMIQAYATKGDCKPLLKMLVPEQSIHLEEYIYGREVIDLLLEHPGVLQSPAELVAMLSRMTPRLYSIASSPLVHSGELHLTVAVVRFRTHDRERGGVASTLMADRVELGDTLPIYIQPNKRFRLPKDGDAPIIMIGPGTGVAPFRSFLFERLQLGAKGRNWLFFGERSEKTDFLYREEWEKMVASGHLTRLSTAFSRDQEKKIYVQDRMMENSKEFWTWLQDGATIYLCGDATHMAKDVDHALLTIVAQQGEMDLEAAKQYVQGLKDQHRYHRDVY